VSGLDIALVGLALLAALAFLFSSSVPARVRTALLLTVGALAVVQLAAEGLYWQFLPLYVLAALLGALLWRGAIGWLSRLAVTGAALASLAAWSVLAVPELPRPLGAHPVGTVVYRWVDPTRLETATETPDDHRNVVAQAWYPITDTRGPRRVYMDGLDRLPAKVNVLPGFVFRSFGAIDTHAVEGAPVSQASSKWPTVIFSPGYGAPRAFYTGLATGLASRGFIVIALDHPYESAIVELADGTVATPIETFLPSDPDRIRYMEVRLKPRVGDVRFLLDQLERGRGLSPLEGRVDLTRIAAVGHSFGGATAAVAAAADRRLAAAADVDGMLYGAVENSSLGRPFLVLESDQQVTRHPDLYVRRTEQLLQRLGATGYRYQLRGANHLSFTDAEFFFARPARPLVRLAIGGSRSAESAQRATVNLLAAFLSEALLGEGSLASAAAREPGVTGGPA
jgi:predicted dienelactone hydrolase